MSGSSSQHTVTQLLKQWRAGNREALEALLPLVYDELRRLARRHMQAERADHTLQHTALVHEAFLRLVESDVAWNDRAHFFAVAARAMRHILIDHARAKARDKRGGSAPTISLKDAPEPAARHVDILAVGEALDRLQAIEERQGEIVELRYFGGLTVEEIAEVLGVSSATIERDLKSAKEWLNRELRPGASPDQRVPDAL